MDGLHWLTKIKKSLSFILRNEFQDNKDVLLLVTTKSLAAKVKCWAFWTNIFHV